MSITLQPLLEADAIIQLHVAAASAALVLGPLALYRTRRDVLHKIVGYSWVMGMGVTALSSFWIHTFPLIGPFSPIHLLAVFALWSLFEGMRHVFAGRIRLHQEVLRSLYWRGLIVAGLFNFLPGRVTNRTVFGDAPELGYVVMALGLGGIVGHAARGWFTRRAPARRAPKAGRSFQPLVPR